MSNSLSTLVQMICDGAFVRQDIMVRKLESKYPVISDSDKEETVTRYLCEDDLIEVIHRLVDSRDSIVKMAQLVSTCPDDEKPENAIRKLLEGLNIPLPLELKESSDVINVRVEVMDMKRKIDRAKAYGTVEPSLLQHVCLGAWGYIEKLLRITLYFYGEIFSDVSEEVKIVSIRGGSLAGYFQGIRSIDKKFKGPDDEDSSREAQILRNEAQVLKKEAQARIKRDNPFSGFDINKYHQEDSTIPHSDKTIQKYRNSFAHATPNDIANQGENRVQEALKIIDDLLVDFINLNIAPRVIYFTAKGWDEYGREILWFVEEQDAKLSLQQRAGRERRMFRRNSGNIEFMKPYFTIAEIKAFMFEPPVCLKQNE